MPTLTVDLPETAYRAALAFPAPERARMIAATFTEETPRFSALEEDEDAPPYDRPTNEADLEAIGRGIQAEAEGRTIPGDVVFARLMDQAKNGRGK